MVPGRPRADMAEDGGTLIFDRLKPAQTRGQTWTRF